jgi:hypothetical protein
MGRPSGFGRPTPISFFEIDIRWLKRNGYLEIGCPRRLVEYINGRPAGEIQLVGFPERIEIVTARSRQSVPVVHTHQPLGGQRPWFLCDCGRRAAILYGTPFRCRECHGIAYPSQRHSKRDAKLAKAQKVRMKLGGSPSLVDPFPRKPRHMHWRTYHRAWARAIDAENTLLANW